MIKAYKNKKILVGICDIGNGHINRQICVINKFLNEGAHVIVATTKEKENIIKDIFPDLIVIQINIPWITCTCNGLNYKDCLDKYKSKKIDQYKNFFEFALLVEKHFGSKPDFVISDYEPNVAQYAYSSMIPLICMEQQSKFIYLNDIEIENSSIKEERYRLNYFFPKFEKKIISSFFPISINDEKVLIVPPIISKFDCKFKDIKKVVVYFSPYSNSEKYEKILNAIKDIQDYNFHVYTENSYTKFQHYKNIKISSFNNMFKDDLASSSFLLSTAGHQLLSEAIYLDIPIYVFPLETYEQKYNALMIEKYKLGYIAKDLSNAEIICFLSQYDAFYKNIREFKDTYYKTSWEEEIEKLLD